MAKSWNILSIDGGGIRGVIPAVLLAELEKQLKANLSDIFDVFAGTSTGGIIALAMVAPPINGKPRTAEDLVKLYESNATDIFPPTVFDVIAHGSGFLKTLWNLVNPKHSASGLTRVLRANFGNALLSQATKDFFVTSYSVTLDGPVMFNRQGVLDGSMPDISFVQAARATSAAPTFFSPQTLQFDGLDHAVVDGGMYANDPSWPVVRYVFTRLMAPGDSIKLLSIGTGFQPKVRMPAEVRHRGLAWVPDVIRLLMKNSMTLSEEASSAFIKSTGGQYCRLQVELPAEIVESMDYTSPINIAELKRVTLPSQLQELPAAVSMLRT